MVGEVVAHYRIVERLGGGAMGVVYRAEDTRLRRAVALKFLPAELTGNAQANARFMREARVASNLDHRNICTVYEIGETDKGELFIAMPFYDGQSLKAILAQGPLDIATALDYAEQIAAGLAHASESGVVHRDIKPANLMITRRGEVKIVDFGLARLQDGAALTRTGTTVGTVAYMAPEQAQGAEVGHAADVWSSGVVLYEMLTGRLPFRGEHEPSLLYAILHTDPEPLVRDGIPLPDDCARIVTSCLTKDISKRCASAADLRRELQAASRPLRTQQEHPTRPILFRQRPSRRLGFLAGLGVAALIALTIAVTPPLRELVSRALHLPAPGGHGVAVLPFTVEGGGEDEQAFCDGMTWLLTDRLSRLERNGSKFWVVPAWLVDYKKVDSSDEARLHLGVDRTIRGSARFQGRRIMMTLLAYDARAGVPSSREFSDDLANLETWQQQVPRAAAQMLGVRLSSDAGRAFARGCTTVPGAFTAWMRGLGWLSPGAGEPDPERAAEEFRYAVAQDSSFACAYTALASALWEGSGRSDSTTALTAADFLRRAAELDTASAWPHAQLGDVYARWGDPEDAIAAYERALARDPRQETALRSLGALYRRRGDFAAAEAAYRRAEQIHPENVINANALGALYYQVARYEDASRWFRRVIDLTPSNYQGYNHLGAVLFELERYDEARAMFEHSLALEPTYAAYTNLGSLCFYRRRFGDAITMFRRSLEIDDTQYPVWGNLGEALYWAPGQRDSSRAAYARGIELAVLALSDDPQDASVLSDLASYHGRLGDREQALAFLQRLTGREELAAETMFTMADTYEMIGQRDRALDWLEKACAADLSIAKVEFYPGLRELRTHARFREMRRRYDD